MKNLREIELMYVKGVGPARAKLLAEELNLKSVHDLLRYFPSHYLDRSNVYKIRDFAGDMPSVQLRGRFISFNVIGEGAKMRLVGLFTDGTSTMEVVWFKRVKQLRELYKTGNEYIVFGKPQEFNGRWSMAHPEVDPVNSSQAQAEFRGIYPLTEKLRNRGVTSRLLYQWIQNALALYAPSIPETLPAEILAQYRFMDAREAILTVHKPTEAETLRRARERLKFEELFYLQLNIRRYSTRRGGAVRGIPFPRIGRFFNSFYSEMLPFPLTGAQKRVLKEIRADLGSGRQMNRLLQGDVGSGKTIVALMTMLIALDNGTQACIMAPTEILATQHYESIRSMAAPLGVNVRLLTGSTKKKERDVIAAELADGSLHILIGTHAVIEENVAFSNLGLAVIDEQHRFGVVQRARLWGKNASTPPHVLVMTATPIPRTLAMTVYGDLDVSVIDELPPGRKPITTLLRFDDQRQAVYRSIGKQLAMGHQVYIVYPLITESEKLDLRSLEEGYELIRDTFPSYRVTYVHGKMKPAEKDYQMKLFAENEAQILVSTTVIEVGVNVPNASTMVIENAERFGLSQLHQLRGRVGRGAAQSYCVLMSKRKIGADTRKRLELMTRTTDGFEIAEADLKTRGPGDLEGTMQSGIPFDLRIANLATDGQLVQLARDCAERLL
ncbi:MAG: ATP-dependent DNA helicase RecG, partial [[Clostridium] fimetarium]|nr:ATP-dependent DNA helicase RecG [Alistipes timonensis]MCM1405536.1 ATP-dependent DNA helicase RecG [[Clostridium] fimetarium]